MKKLLSLLSLTLLFTTFSYAQISQGGSPSSFSKSGTLTSLTSINVTPPNPADLVYNEGNGEVFEIAKIVPANIDFIPNATQDIVNGEVVYRLSIKSAGAKALTLYYSNFIIPHGGNLYLYNKDKTQILGSFTSANNLKGAEFATELVAGDEIILEYNHPNPLAILPLIRISDIAYAYRNVGHLSHLNGNGGRGFDDAESCMINANCPEGDGWDDQKRSVTRILLRIGGGAGWCSGSVMNNTAQDCTPYVLTADHCGDGATAQDRNQWIFYFNYEAAGCANPTAEGNLDAQSMVGCTQRANSGGGGSGGSDFLLVELNNAIPQSYNAFYAGWSIATPLTGGVGIHHPAGDIKKISTYNDDPVISGGFNFAGTTHWDVEWITTQNGRSTLEGGSSGSPLFDASGRVIGDLTGVVGSGFSPCNSPNATWIYGRMGYSWDQNGGAASQGLKTWLDPENKGVTTMNGTNFPCGDVSFTASTTILCEGDEVRFDDASINNPSSWNWNFTGGVPSTSTQADPSVTYASPGAYDVSLTITNSNGNSTTTLTNYIVVFPNPTGNFTSVAATCGGSMDGELEILPLTGSAPYTYEWSTGATTRELSNLDPGEYEVTVTDANGCQLVTSETVGSVNNVNVFSVVNPDTSGTGTGSISVGATGGAAPYTYEWNDGESQTGNLAINLPAGEYIVTITDADGCIYTDKFQVLSTFNPSTSLNDLEAQYDLTLFPNPSQGLLNLNLSFTETHQTNMSVINALGQEVLNQNWGMVNSVNESVDLSTLQNGVYSILIRNESFTISRNFILAR